MYQHSRLEMPAALSALTSSICLTKIFAHVALKFSDPHPSPSTRTENRQDNNCYCQASVFIVSIESSPWRELSLAESPLVATLEVATTPPYPSLQLSNNDRHRNLHRPAFVAADKQAVELDRRRNLHCTRRASANSHPILHRRQPSCRASQRQLSSYPSSPPTELSSSPSLAQFVATFRAAADPTTTAVPAFVAADKQAVELSVGCASIESFALVTN